MNVRIQPLQYAADLDMATEAERAQLVAWKTYRVLLNRVDISTAPDIDWPDHPSETNRQNHGFKTVIHRHSDSRVTDQMG